MDLRQTEDIIQNLVSIYESIRQSPVWTTEQAELLMELPTNHFPIVEVQSVPPPPGNATTDAHTASNSNNSAVGANQQTISASNNQETPTHYATSNFAPNTTPTTTTTTFLPPFTNFRPSISITERKILVESLHTLKATLGNDNDKTNHLKNNNSHLDLPTKMIRFRSKLEEKDPVTLQPRYGPKSQARVQRLVCYFDFLCQQVLGTKPFGSHSSSSSLIDSSSEPSPSSVLFQAIQDEYQNEQKVLQEQQALQEQSQQYERERQEKEWLEQTTQQHAVKQAREAQEAAAQAEQLRIQAEESRRRKRAQEEKRQLAERQYLESIRKGTDGVRYYLRVLQESTANDPAAQSKALQSLCTIFEQIQKHPEETRFRKIRKNHPAFHQDIGRHKGGIELLIAAGFRPTLLAAENKHVQDDIVSPSVDPNNNNHNISDIPTMVASLVSQEPNLETDMDGWTEWYDLNKATLEILQSARKQ